MFLFHNEELAFPDEEKQNARVEIAFAAREKQNANEEMAIPDEEKQNPCVEITFPAQERQNPSEAIKARQSSGSLRSEASQGSSTASRRATRVLDKLPRGFVFNYGELALPGFEVQSVLPLFRSRAFLRGRERKASWRDWLQQTTPGRFSTGTTIVSLRSSITYDAAKSSRQQEQIERDTTEAYCPCDASAE